MNSIPIRRDTAGATRVLIRNAENSPSQLSQPQNQADKTGNSESEILQNKTDQPGSVSEQQVTEPVGGNRQELEQRLSLALEEQARMQKQWSLAETRIIQQDEQSRAAKEQWNLWWTALRARAEAVEASSSAIEQAVRLEHGDLAEKHAAEVLRLEDARLALEQEKYQAEEECARLRESLAAAEARIGNQDEQLRAEKERWNLWRTALNARLEAVEAGGRALEQAVLLEHGKLAEKYSSEILQLENARQALEQEKRQAEEECVRLRESLAAAQARTENQTEQLAQGEESRLQFEKRAAALSNELSQMMVRYSQVVEESQTERTRWESAQNELDQRNASLDERLKVAEQRYQELLEEREAYRIKWESSAVELGQLRSDVQTMSALARESADKYQLLLNKLRELSGISEQLHHLNNQDS